MVLCDRVLAVWCETLDDITVLRQAGETEVAEFVQVKAHGADQLWSVSQLCKRTDAEPGSSILEKSLANDRCSEQCVFTVVTTRDLRSELKPLSLAPEEPARAEAIPGLGAKFLQRLADYTSPNGHDAAWWTQRARWHVLHSSDAARHRNLLLVSKVVEANGVALFSDQIDTVYQLLLHRIVTASAKDKNVERNAGKFERAELKQWLSDRIKEAHDNGLRAGSGLLREKLHAAGLDDVAIAAATELRRSYHARTLEPSYLDLNNIRIWEDKVRARLNRLRVRLDTGAVTENGVDFHARSLRELAGLRRELNADDAPDEILQGCMYHITAQCQHRFVRPEI